MAVTLFLSGDVMLGRGVDQVLASPGDPRLEESYVRDARRYVALAEEVNGPVPAPVDPAWPWGVALEVLADAAPDARIVNLETSVTTSDRFARGKEVHYRMHPGNLPALVVARPDVCVLANNHVLDFGRRGLVETLDVLAGAGLVTAGAGCDDAAAWHPAAVPVAGGRRVLVLACGTPSSGVPACWAAEAGRPGVAYLPELTGHAAERLAARVAALRRPGDTAVVSIHWGSNWGHDISPDQTGFAHRLVDAGIDVVHGHSSHHPRAIEVYRGRLVLYGCGDFVDDYEGIAGHARHRPDLRLLYLAVLDDDGKLRALRMVPLQARRLRLRRASPADAAWLAADLTAAAPGIGRPVTTTDDGELRLVLPV